MSLSHFFLLLFAVVVFAVGAYLIIKTERASIPPVWHPSAPMEACRQKIIIRKMDTC